MRRLVLLLATLALGLGGLAAAQSGEPEGSQFIDSNDGGSFAFPSNSGWDIKGPQKERVVGVAREANPNASSPFDRQGMQILWAKKCTAEKQRVHFVREVYLAGPEYKLGAGISLLRGANSAGFKSARMLVNGHQVIKVGPGGGNFDQTEKRPKVFRFGVNNIEVIAIKRPNPRPRPCNQSPKPGDVTGVMFNAYGEFAGDLGLPPQATNEYRRLEEGTYAVNIPLKFDVRNSGPGGLARVPLYVKIEVPVTGEPHGTLIRVKAPTPPVHSCKATPPESEISESPRTIICTIANFRSGTIASQVVNVAFYVPSGSSRTPVYVRWSVSAEEPTGADGTNNERYKTIWLCKWDDPDPACV